MQKSSVFFSREVFKYIMVHLHNGILYYTFKVYWARPSPRYIVNRASHKMICIRQHDPILYLNIFKSCGCVCTCECMCPGSLHTTVWLIAESRYKEATPFFALYSWILDKFFLQWHELHSKFLTKPIEEDK